MTLSISTLCHYAEWCIEYVVMLSGDGVIMLNVIMLNVIMLSVMVLNLKVEHLVVLAQDFIFSCNWV